MKIRNNPEEQARIHACTDEIRAILQKYDFAGVVSVTGKDTSRHMFEVSPSWSCITFERTPDDNAVGIRFKARMKTGGEAERQRGFDSIGLVLGLLDASQVNVEQLGKLLGVISQQGQMVIDHIAERLKDRRDPEP